MYCIKLFNSTLKNKEKELFTHFFFLFLYVVDVIVSIFSVFEPWCTHTADITLLA